MIHKRAKTTYFIESNDPWGINQSLLSISSMTQSSLAYSPYYEQYSPFILAIEFTQRDAYFLLKNATVIRLSQDNASSLSSSSIKREEFQYRDEFDHIKLPTKIVDISCGNEHTLAKGKDRKIYSWGSNTYGQLGWGNCDFGKEDYIVPHYIPTFLQWKIDQIYATGYNSFCITDDNTIFGFGNVIDIYIITLYHY